MTVIAYSSYILFCWVALAAMRRGNALLMLIALTPLVLASVGGLIVPIVLAIRRRSEERKQAATPPPEGVPAYASRANVTASGRYAEGRIWVQDGFLHFSGDRLGFKLKPSDVARFSGSRQLVANVQLPKDWPRIGIAICLYDDPSSAAQHRAFEEAASKIKSWAAETDPSGDSVLPPIRPASMIDSLKRVCHGLARLSGWWLFLCGLPLVIASVAEDSRVFIGVFTLAFVPLGMLLLARAGMRFVAKEEKRQCEKLESFINRQQTVSK